ncbi:MAG TPA: undecaprenyldiphospho-muramoylpentapeptide beta-N-acetylglucosaminyltransferase [Polyangia bacterium]|jgi:UDP-N-acetylglucosamine--N-acetylmuramyl-(pentapeptide) pyrophosphoryl-undecaprenol N-acetylglucosamine transferase|nr:undecaprenyldiphospho-muramoylpentapeptide beta-N-acetylglucosaminyltransferase [Polyangia bacterium]
MADSGRPLRLLVAGGGTGGHLYPGIAIAEEVKATTGGEAVFVGTARGLESKLVPAAGFPLELVKVSGLKRMGLRGLVRGMMRLPGAFIESARILRRHQPDVVLGVGGYASGPLVFAAALLGYPTAIHEANSLPGFTNRMLARLVRRVFVAFDDAAARFARRKVRYLGNPVRRSFLDRVAAGAPTEEGNAIVILGGSQGSRAVNELASGMVRVLDARGRLPPVIHQTGADQFAEMQVNYAALGYEGRVDVRPFIDDMPAVLSKAAVIVARAGALTLAELAIMRRPAILIPLPTAADDHQTMNALAFERAGAAVLLPQADASATRLGDLVDEILRDPARRAAMAAAMGTLARASATRDIVAELTAIARRSG